MKRTTGQPWGPDQNQGEDWHSGHVYYHQDLDRVVRGFVHPLVTAVARDGNLTGFFYIRHGLGGPHIRLRLRPVTGTGERVLHEMKRFARAFLDREPSTRSLDVDAIRRTNASILQTDIHEIDDSVYPDNSFHLVPFRPEIERYGGPDLSRCSIDYFTLSSTAAIDFHLRMDGAARPVLLAQAYGLLLRQAVGFATDANELIDLLRYGTNWLGRKLTNIVETADRVAGSQMEDLLQVFFVSLDEGRSLRAQADPSDLSARDFLAAGAARLSTAIGPSERKVRLRIGASQLHMTASRLGLSNAEEVYLSRLLTLTLDEARSARRTDFSWLRETPEEGGGPDTTVHSLVPYALAQLSTLSDTREP